MRSIKERLGSLRTRSPKPNKFSREVVLAPANFDEYIKHKDELVVSREDFTALIRRHRQLDMLARMEAVAYNRTILHLFFGVLKASSKCTCKSMKIGNAEHPFVVATDGFYEPVLLSAVEFFEMTLLYIQSKLNNPTNFPDPDFPGEFPRDYTVTIEDLFARISILYSHVTSQHYDVLVAEGIHSHWNSSLEFFALQSEEYKFIDHSVASPQQLFFQGILSRYGEIFQ